MAAARPGKARRGTLCDARQPSPSVPCRHRGHATRNCGAPCRSAGLECCKAGGSHIHPYSHALASYPPAGGPNTTLDKACIIRRLDGIAPVKLEFRVRLGGLGSGGDCDLLRLRSPRGQQPRSHGVPRVRVSYVRSPPESGDLRSEGRRPSGSQTQVQSESPHNPCVGGYECIE